MLKRSNVREIYKEIIFISFLLLSVIIRCRSLEDGTKFTNCIVAPALEVP